MFTISIGKADAVCPDRVTLTSGMVKAVRVAFMFSEEWEGFRKVVVFSNGVTGLDVSLGDDNTCYVPHEVLADAGKDVTCGVYGYKGEGDERVAIPTVRCLLGKVVEGVNPSGEESAGGTPTVWEEIDATLNRHEEVINNPYYIQAVNLKGITTATPAWDTDVNIYDNSVDSAGGTFDIDIRGDIRFDCDVVGGLVCIYVDGVEVARLGDEHNVYNYSYDGIVTSGMRVETFMAGATFTEFIKKVYIKDEIGDIVKTVGDIDKALDELHSYAQSLIGGEA